MSAAKETSIVIRDIDLIDEVHAVEDLQKEVWGIPDIEVVPLSQLIAAKTSGGVLLGAFDRKEMVGFAYGFVGRERGETVHHSHMLAVKPAYRSHDLGFRLKAAQRQRVLAQGINTMTWTFDPLQCMNAYFNFGKLGVVSDQYFVNFYGEDAASFLHRNGTDRLWVTWFLPSSRVVERIEKAAKLNDPPNLTRLIEIDANDRPICNEGDEALSGDQALIEIPADINVLEREKDKLAFEWRAASRWAFTKALAAGFIVEDFCRTTRSGRSRGIYVLTRNDLTNLAA